MKKTLRLSFPLLFLGLIFVLSACVDSFTDPALEKIKEQKLIVDGLITTDLERFKVTLSKSKAPLDRTSPDIIANANVIIIDNLQNQYELFHTIQGIYQTKTPQRAIIGRSYKVIVDLLNGNKYESSTELVKPVPQIDLVKDNFVEARDVNGLRTPYFDVTAEFQDSPTKGDYYRWDWVNYQYLVYCENALSNGAGKTLTRTKCCEDCWSIKKTYGEINLTDDYLFNGQKISQTIAKVPFISRRPYYMDIGLYSISGAAHQYWKTVKAQVKNVGGVFDNPPTTVKGNIRNIANPDEQVFGFFSASATVRKQIYVLRSKALSVPIIPALGARVIFAPGCSTVCPEGDFRSRIKPKNWNDDYNVIFYEPELEF
jgi:Domain of unknown function (DUF4249)